MNGARPRTTRSGEGEPNPDSAAAAGEAAPGGGRSEGERLPRASRIRQTKEIRDLLRRGKRKRTSHLDVFVASSPVSLSRLGLVVPRHRHAVVERNRLKRRLREVGRRQLLPRLAEAGLAADVLIRARPEAYEATFQELQEQVVELAETLCSDGPSWA